MPLPFTPEQMQEIRARLFESACRHAAGAGMKKTSLDALTTDAGISKSTFYKFYQSKERLFLEVAWYWEGLVIQELERVLHEPSAQSDKERTATAVSAAFEKLNSLGAMRFFQEDLPMLAPFFSMPEALRHFESMSQCILEILKREHIRFTVPEDVMLSVIHLLYLCIQHAEALGDQFNEALRQLVLSACEKLVT